MKKIGLFRSTEVALVDDEDYFFLSRFNWCVKNTPSNTYAIALVAGIPVPMHRLILNPSAYEEVDHADQDGLNNQKKNLRIASRAHNSVNRKKVRGKGKYIGVQKRISTKGEESYSAVTYRSGRNTCHGVFKTEIEAAKARDEAAKKIWGAHAALNFPERK